MYQIYKDSELYKFVNCHLFDQHRYWPGEGYGYTFCSYAKDVAKSAAACISVYGCIAYLAIFGIVPWGLWMFGDYPLPMSDHMTWIGVASVLMLIIVAAAALMGMVAGVCISVDKTHWNDKVLDYTKAKLQNNSIGEFVTTAWRAHKEKYCPLVDVVDTRPVDDDDTPKRKFRIRKKV